MKTSLKRFLFWTPRVLCLLFAGFISLFALDVLGGGHGFWETVLALLMHLVPTALVLILLAVSWRWEWIGGVAFPALGLLYLINFWGKFHWSAYALIAGPMFLVGALFLVNWRCRETLHAA